MEQNTNNYCVIMAGGVGSRFWPLSRTNRPKQFLDVLGTGKTLLQQTFDRFNKIIPSENIIVVTNADYKDIILEQLPAIKAEHVLLEPSRKNTAPCIAYANHKILASNPEANIVVAPSDHLIIKEEEFLRIVTKGLEFVSENEALLTLGIKPSRPETGYGYIQVNPEDMKDNLTKVKTFTEKPDYELAKVFYESGEFYWNSGIFFWSLNTIMNAFDQDLPEVNSLFREGKGLYNTEKETEFINNAYPRCKSISVDYGIMEKADNVYVICSDFGWSDLGTWGSLYEHSHKDNKGNTVSGENVFAYNLENCLVKVPKDKLVVVQGLKDYIVVESDDILLICRKEDEQRIKQFVNDVKIKNGDSFI
ncbi:MAG TPA: mannose-1-phosphate guanylyltransferase [Bacteroidales bacterium]|nr:mannose-1-phosphate guanylyltransferase [Bacteroidales bacterium]